MCTTSHHTLLMKEERGIVERMHAFTCLFIHFRRGCIAGKEVLLGMFVLFFAFWINFNSLQWRHFISFPERSAD